ncbi:hypothetical protein [Leptotrichia sp. OH3620_COT-345]|nr:hypothetical protein [Leptotrichia sp. OH3620_COT-345]
MDCYEKTNDIIVSSENEEENIYLRGEIYENNILKEKFILNKKVKEFKKI